MRKAYACCNEHMTDALVYMSRCEAVKIVRIGKPDILYNCYCEAPATWFFKEIKP